jgi:hypothetical protein
MRNYNITLPDDLTEFIDQLSKRREFSHVVAVALREYRDKFAPATSIIENLSFDQLSTFDIEKIRLVSDATLINLISNYDDVLRLDAILTKAKSQACETYSIFQRKNFCNGLLKALAVKTKVSEGQFDLWVSDMNNYFAEKTSNAIKKETFDDTTISKGENYES